MGLSAKVKRKIVSEAVEFFDGYPIDWNQLKDGKIEGDESPVNVNWDSKVSGEIVLCLSSIWFDDDGAILEAGTNYGILTL
jgi:hypothetical protein